MTTHQQIYEYYKRRLKYLGKELKLVKIILVSLKLYLISYTIIINLVI